MFKNSKIVYRKGFKTKNIITESAPQLPPKPLEQKAIGTTDININKIISRLVF